MIKITVLFLIIRTVSTRAHLPVGRYCAEGSICKKHVMCEYPQARMACDYVMKDVNMGRNLLTYVTHLHNQKRNEVALGESSLKLKASNMKLLTWNKKLERYAQRYANSCYITTTDGCRDLMKTFCIPSQIKPLRWKSASFGRKMNTPDGKIMKIGQLVMRYFVPDYNLTNFIDITTELVHSVLDTWMQTGHNLTADMINNYTHYNEGRYPFSAIFDPKDYRAFTQVVWADTTRIGCGFISYYGNKGVHFVLVCNYQPSGNIPGKPVYRIGKPCSECRMDVKVCNKYYKGLCGTACHKRGTNILFVFVLSLYYMCYLNK